MIDPSTSSNPEFFKTLHTSIEWLVDFEEKVLKGNVLHKMQVVDANYTQLVSNCLNYNLTK